MPAKPTFDLPAISRSQLYELVWQHEAEAIAAHCNISGSLLARVCREWKIPKPGRGQWQQMTVGQRIKRPLLLPWPGTRGDPVILCRNTAGGYGTSVPKKVRPPRPKIDHLAQFLEKMRVERRGSEEAKERENAEHAALIDGQATRHVLAVVEWQVEHDINMALYPALSFEDATAIRLDCRTVLPGRRGSPVQVEVRFRWQREGAWHGRIAEPIGRVRRGRRQIDLYLAEDKAAFICSALTAGRVRLIDLEVVRDAGGRDVIRWARFCTRTHDGIEAGPEISGS